jgi:hypothetical protein
LSGKADTASESDLDLSGLFEKRVEPTLDSIAAEFAEFKTAITGLELTNDQQIALQRLEDAMAVQVTPPTLKRQSSNGPRWKQAMLDYVENNYNIYEDASHVGHDSRAQKECKIDKVHNYDLPELVIESVKPIEGSSKSIAYIVVLVVPVYGQDDTTSEMKWCDHNYTQYAFENSYENGQVKQIKSFPSKPAVD